MKWVSHQLLTGTAVLAVTENPLLALIAAQGAVYPDVIERILPVSHRTWTHWWPVYVVPLIGCYYLLQTVGLSAVVSLDTLGYILQAYPGETVHLYLKWSVFWFLIGALAHLIEDLATGYIPVWTPYDRFKYKHPRLWYQGSPVELPCVLLMCACICVVKGITLLTR